MKRIILSAALLLAATSAFALNISGSSHDLSSTGTNPSKGTSDQLCKYCHVPHNASTTITTALWGRNNDATGPAVYYTNAGSLNATPGAPSNTQSTACLGCHNVSPSTGLTADTNITGGIATANKRINEAVTGLSNDHPIAFVYDATLVTNDTATGGGITGLQTPGANTVNNASGASLPLFNGNSLECATCHAVHGAGHPSFLRTTAAKSAICLKCHIK